MRFDSQMRREIDEIPEAAARFLDASFDAAASVGARLRQLDPKVVTTVARGSSDHVATYFKYATELATGLPVASIGPSVVSVYGTALRLAGQATLAISQSGQSPDIVALLTAARAGGAETIAVGNVEGSPLLAAAQWPITLSAGPELSVAATKSFVCSVLAALSVLAGWTEDRELRQALAAFPEHARGALEHDWSSALATCEGATSLFTLGRGPSFAVASEAALKLKETSVLHAEAYSGAEVLHGPVSLVEKGFPVLAFAPADAALPGLSAICGRMVESGAVLFSVGRTGHGIELPHTATGHPLTEPLSMLVSFYRFVESVSIARGHDPDRPRGLLKVTETT